MNAKVKHRESVAKKPAATNDRSFRTFLLVEQFAAREIGDRIAEARRRANGMTQQTLGDLIGVSARSIQDYEAGVTIPWKHMREIAEITETRVEWLLHGEGEPDRLARVEALATEASERLRRIEALLEESVQSRAEHG